MKNINQNINYTMTYADVKKDEPRQSGNDKFKPGLFAERCEHSYKFQTKSEFSAALSQIAHSADHIIAAKIPTQQTEWDDLVQNGKSQHKLIYIYPNEDLTHVTPLYIDTATKKVYSLPDLDGTELASLPSGYTHCMPAISIYHGKVTFQEDDLSCSYIALQFGKKIENMLTINQKLIILAGEELPSTIQEGTFIFKKNGQDPEVDYYLLPESFYGITQRRSPIILNEAIVTLVAKKQLNNPLKYAQNNAQYKIEFEKYFIRHKSSDKTDKFAYVQENIKRNSYKKTYSKKISAVKAPLMYELKQLKLEDKPKSKALALAVKTCLLTGAIPSKDFYQYFKLSQDEFWEQLRTFISQDPQQILGLIQN